MSATRTAAELEVNVLIREMAGFKSFIDGYRCKVDVAILLIIAEARGWDVEATAEYVGRLVSERTLVEVEPNLLFVPAPF
jgi:hypothetical protein